MVGGVVRRGKRLGHESAVGRVRTQAARSGFHEKPPGGQPLSPGRAVLESRVGRGDRAAAKTLEAISGDSRLVALAATLPSPAVRTALLRALQRQWDEGPKGLKSLVAPDGSTVEPGFLVLTKMLPRKRRRGAGGGQDPRGRDANRAVAGAKSVKMADLRAARQRQEQTAQKWMEFSQRRRSHALRTLLRGSLARPNPAALAEGTADDWFPVKLHPNAEVVAVCRLDWPEGLDGEIAAAPFSTDSLRANRAQGPAQPAVGLLPSATARLRKTRQPRRRLARQSYRG